MCLIVRSTPRRALLAAAAVVVLAALGFLGARPLSAGAAPNGSDGDVVLGLGGQATSGITGVNTTGLVGLDGISTNANGTGVYGSGSFYGMYGTGSTAGVFGYNSASTGIGVEGQTGGNGSAVYGQATGPGTGVYGDTTDGTGVLAHSINGTALWVNGSADFSQSGVAVVPSGANHITVSGVTTASMILATVQQSGGFYVKYAVAGSGSFTIYINKAPASPTKVNVAFIVLN
jgi:hypothetical protein